MTASVPAIVKAISIIRYLDAAPGGCSTLPEISGTLGLTKSHCHNLLKTLVAEGWANYDKSRHQYMLAPSLLTDLKNLVGRDHSPLLVHDELIRLSLSTRTPCVLTRLGIDNSFVAIDKAEEAAELLVSVPIGHRFPPDAPAQMRVRLAGLDDDALEKELKTLEPIARTATTIVDRAQLKQEIIATRQRGYAISRGEFTPGVMSLAAGILDRSGQLKLVVQCPGLQADMEERENEIAAELLEAAQKIALLGPAIRNG